MNTVKRKFGLIIAAVILMSVFIMPAQIKNILPDSSIKDWLMDRKIHLGLDLQGGTQLDYKIDLNQAKAYNEDDDPDNDVNLDQLIDGVKATIERRVNVLGVSEPQIQISTVANEQHIIVELPGVKNMEDAKAAVGKTIQLEFKEMADELEEDEFKRVQKSAESLFKEINASGSDFRTIAENAQNSNNRIQLFPEQDFFFDQMPPGIKDAWDVEEGEIYPELIKGDIRVPHPDTGEAGTVSGLFIVKNTSQGTGEREITEPGENFMEMAKEVSDRPEEIDLELKTQDELDASLAEQIWNINTGEVSEIIEQDEYWEIYKPEKHEPEKDEISARHILISFTDAQGAEEELMRTKEQAKERAEEVIAKLESGEDFSTLATKYSDDPGAEANKGDLGSFGRGRMVPEFEKAAFALEIDRISDAVESPFGFHIIQKYNEETQTEKKQFFRIAIKKDGEEAKEKIREIKTRVEEKQVNRQEDKRKFQIVFISTEPDNWKETGLDGRHFRRAVVTTNQLNQPSVSIEFDDEGGELFEKITEKNVGKPLAIFVGGVLISAPRVNAKIAGGHAQITGNYTYKEAVDLKNDLNTGAIPAPIFLVGQYQIGASLGEESLNKSLWAGILGLLILMGYMILYYRFLGLLADCALIIYAVIILFILHSSSAIGMPIVLTLAGIAGVILSIGMAVDANILIFERLKEELKNGKNLSAAINIGFQRAWTSIRDSNLSTIITCIILAWFGSSIIRGFAITLGIGVIFSIFTAITVTKTFLKMLLGTKIAKYGWLFGVKEIVEDYKIR